MAGNYLSNPSPQWFDDNGDPLNLGTVEFFEAGGTNTPLDTFTDQDLTGGNENANPLPLDSDGRSTTNVFLQQLSYNIVVKDSAGATIANATRDNVSNILQVDVTGVPEADTVAAMTALTKASLTDLSVFRINGRLAKGDNGGGFFQWNASSTAAVNLGTIFQTDEGSTGRWLRMNTNEGLYFEQFGAVLDGVTDDSVAFASAITDATAKDVPIYLTGQLFSPTTLTVPVGITIIGYRGSLNASVQAIEFITDQDISLLKVTGRFTTLTDFAIRQTSVAGTSKGIEFQDNVTAFNVHERLVTQGFNSGVFGERTLYHTHRDCYYENGNIGANYIGASGAWNSVWFNNIILFERCRFSANSVKGAFIKGVSISFDTCDASNVPIGFEIVGDSTTNPSFASVFTNTFNENCNKPYKFQFATAQINGGFAQGFGVPVAGDQVITADESNIFVKSKIDGQDLWDTFANLTNNSTLVFDDEDVFGVTGFLPTKFTTDSNSFVNFMTQKFPGQTAQLIATTGVEDIFTPTQGRSYQLTVWTSDDDANFFWSGTVMALSSSILRIGIIQSDATRVAVGNNSGAIQIQNLSGSNKTFNWSLVEIT